MQSVILGGSPLGIPIGQQHSALFINGGKLLVQVLIRVQFDFQLGRAHISVTVPLNLIRNRRQVKRLFGRFGRAFRRGCRFRRDGRFRRSRYFRRDGRFGYSRYFRRDGRFGHNRFLCAAFYRSIRFLFRARRLFFLFFRLFRRKRDVNQRIIVALHGAVFVFPDEGFAVHRLGVQSAQAHIAFHHIAVMREDDIDRKAIFFDFLIVKRQQHTLAAVQRADPAFHPRVGIQLYAVARRFDIGKPFILDLHQDSGQFALLLFHRNRRFCRSRRFRWNRRFRGNRRFRRHGRFSRFQFLYNLRLFGRFRFFHNLRFLGRFRFFHDLRFFGRFRFFHDLRFLSRFRFLHNLRFFGRFRFLHNLRLFGRFRFLHDLRFFGRFRFSHDLRFFGRFRFSHRLHFRNSFRLALLYIDGFAADDRFHPLIILLIRRSRLAHTAIFPFRMGALETHRQLLSNRKHRGDQDSGGVFFLHSELSFFFPASCRAADCTAETVFVLDRKVNHYCFIISVTLFFFNTSMVFFNIFFVCCWWYFFAFSFFVCHCHVTVCLVSMRMLVFSVFPTPFSCQAKRTLSRPWIAFICETPTRRLSPPDAVLLRRRAAVWPSASAFRLLRAKPAQSRAPVSPPGAAPHRQSPPSAARRA